MKLFRKIELTNYTLGSAKVEKWSFYYLLSWNFWKSLKQGEDGNLEIDEQSAYLGII